MKKSINLFKNIIFSNFRRLSSPYKVTFALTYKCNLRCKICNIWKSQSLGEVTVLEIEKIFKKIPELNWVDLTGGEVTLRENSLDVVKVIIRNSEKLSIFHISSNGQLSDKLIPLVEVILKTGVIPVVNISIDGPKGINDELRGGTDTYVKSIETFNSLKKLRKGHYHLSCTISNYNINYIDELLADLSRDVSRFSYSDIHFNVFHNSPHYYNNEGIDGLSGLDLGILKTYLGLRKKGSLFKKIIEDKYVKGVFVYLKTGKVRAVKCQALNSSCFINPQGMVYPCLIYNQTMGNLRDQDYDISRLWNSPDVFMVHGKIKEKACPDCWGACEAFSSILGDINGSLKMA